MREWRRAGRLLPCSHAGWCVIEPGDPYRLDTSLRRQQTVCAKHAGVPVDRAQLEAYDQQQARRDAAPGPRTVSTGALSFDAKMAAAGDDQ